MRWQRWTEKRSDEGFKNTSEGGHDGLQKGIAFASRLPKPRFRGCIATPAHFQESRPLLGAAVACAKLASNPVQSRPHANEPTRQCPPMLDNLLSMARVRACKTGSARTLEERSTQKVLLVQARDRLNCPSISTPRPAKAHHRLHHRHNKQAALLAASGGMRAPGRGQAAWRSILDSLQLSLFSGEISPPHSGGPLAPTRRAHRFLHAKLCPDPTPRGHDHGWPSVGNATTSMRCPSAGKPSSSSTSHCAIRIQIQISTNCPNIACHANLAAAANQRALYHSHSGAQQMPSSPPLLAV